MWRVLNLVQRPSFQPEAVGFQFLGIDARPLQAGQSITSETGDNELGIVVLGGQCSVRSSAGSWERIGRRRNVFDGVAYTLYLPVGTAFTLTADTDCDV